MGIEGIEAKLNVDGYPVEFSWVEEEGTLTVEIETDSAMWAMDFLHRLSHSRPLEPQIIVGSVGPDPQDLAADFQKRMSAAEYTVSDLTQRIDTLTHDLAVSESKLDAVKADKLAVNARLTEVLGDLVAARKGHAEIVATVRADYERVRQERDALSVRASELAQQLEAYRAASVPSRVAGYVAAQLGRAVEQLHAGNEADVGGNGDGEFADAAPQTIAEDSATSAITVQRGADLVPIDVNSLPKEIIEAPRVAHVLTHLHKMGRTGLEAMTSAALTIRDHVPVLKTLEPDELVNRVRLIYEKAAKDKAATSG